MVPSSPLVPLFLGMDDDMVIQSPPGSPPPARVVPGLSGEDYSPASPPPHDLNEVGMSRPAQELTTPKRQAMWEAELARSPTPPPTADEIVNAILAPPHAVTLEYRLNVQPLTPPPHWRGRQTLPPPPPDRHFPTNSEIVEWAELFMVADLLVRVVDCHFPLDWDVPTGSLLEHCCFASTFTNPFGERNRVPRACTHCYLAGLGNCERSIPAHPGMEYLGDSTPSMQPCGLHQAKRAHLTVANGYGPRFVQSEEWVLDPIMSMGWATAMWVIWHLPNLNWVSSVLHTLQDFVTHHNRLYLE
ncbi:hypothetical protein NDA14_004776 [Ustilago hordei]|nr:hypothetical protein NDA14_004776 [Ustilago hordei]